MQREEFGWIADRRLQTVLGALDANGAARLVGGCVRDSLLGRNPLEEPDIDIDVATDRTPEEMRDIFNAAGLRWVATGEEHGTLTVIHEGLVAECTALRSDEETDGRRAVVRFTRDWDEDWRRRDFTINAIYADAEGALFDPAGGVADLRARRVRFIGDPAERIREDALRMLRFFRFSARFAERFDAAALRAIRNDAELLDILSKERVWSELSRTFAASRAPEALDEARRTGLLERILPGKPRTESYGRLHALEPPDPALAIAALWPGQSREALRENLKPSAAFLDAYERIEAAKSAIREQMPPLELLYRFGREASLGAARLYAAEGAGIVADGLVTELERLGQPKLPISGKDVVARGVAPGPEIGEAVKRFERLWLDAGAPQSDEDAGRLLDEALGGETPR